MTVNLTAHVSMNPLPTGTPWCLLTQLPPVRGTLQADGQPPLLLGSPGDACCPEFTRTAPPAVQAHRHPTLGGQATHACPQPSVWAFLEGFDILCPREGPREPHYLSSVRIMGLVASSLSGKKWGEHWWSYLQPSRAGLGLPQASPAPEFSELPFRFRRPFRTFQHC